MKPVEVIRAMLDRFREQDIDGFLALLHPEIRIEGLKGDFTGHKEVRRWATAVPTGELSMNIEIDRLLELSDVEVAAAARRQWLWREGGEVADESPFGVLFTFRDGLIYRWRQRFESLDEAIAAAAEPEPG